MTSKTPTLDFKPLFAPEDRKKDLSSHRYRLLIGVLGFMLPILLLVIAWLRPTKGIERLDLLSSVSAYYYTEAVVAFVSGSLLPSGYFSSHTAVMTISTIDLTDVLPS